MRLMRGRGVVDGSKDAGVWCGGGACEAWLRSWRARARPIGSGMGSLGLGVEALNTGVQALGSGDEALSSGVEALSFTVEALHSGVDALISGVGALISERQEFCAPASRL